MRMSSALQNIPAFDEVLALHGRELTRLAPRVLQVNTGKLCNLTCVHCHVNAGPRRKEIITRETVDRIIDWLRGTEIEVVDLTGGTPEMIPDFRYMVRAIRAMGKVVMDRCNLTILNEPGYEWVADFHAEQGVEVVASMPCYCPKNVNEQRGDGVYADYMQLLLDHFNPASVGGLMCRDTINVDWEGRVYDCDFNQQFGLQHGERGDPLKVWDVDFGKWAELPILTGLHCYGCTAGQGSSCGGATV